MKIVLVGEIDDTWRRELRAALHAADVAADWDADAAQAEVAVVANPPPGALATSKRLRLIQSLWAGVDRLLGDASLPPEVPLARMVDPVMNAAMAETALWATLALQRGFFAYARQQRQGLWRVLPQRRADELQVLVLGQGEMGRTATERLRQQGYRVSGWRRGIDLEPQLSHSQIVINLLPLTPQTGALLNASFFAALPPGAAIVNLGRGGHVVDADLLAALDSGHLQHAVLDVFQTEPLPAEHRYWSHPKLTLLPHAAALTDPRSASAVVAANLRALRDGLPLRHLVDRSRGY
jgi:glyoxylate/hydroxypyruvate reductase A